MSPIRRMAQRTAMAICTPDDRRWIEAMLAESRTMDDDFAGPAAVWQVAFASLGARIDRIMAAPLLFAAILSAHVAIVAVALSRTEIEFHGVDDDVCLRIAGGAAAVMIAIIASAMGSAIARPASADVSTLEEGR